MNVKIAFLAIPQGAAQLHTSHDVHGKSSEILFRMKDRLSLTKALVHTSLLQSANVQNNFNTVIS